IHSPTTPAYTARITQLAAQTDSPTSSIDWAAIIAEIFGLTDDSPAATTTIPTATIPTAAAPTAAYYEDPPAAVAHPDAAAVPVRPPRFVLPARGVAQLSLQSHSPDGVCRAVGIAVALGFTPDGSLSLRPPLHIYQMRLGFLPVLQQSRLVLSVPDRGRWL